MRIKTVKGSKTFIISIRILITFVKIFMIAM